ncbi:BEACH domain-containing protein C2-like isoform X2 [Phragmites australis]|uniref:BEACH domain-containing protein C2-like isoform X2 n=1 Tax=Phragmites australis TaxID=29695 RepID=UPI002D765E54|nr:BEACH domain-containing protein C2-like isoform X2 [Phragmites australis]
MSDASPPTPWEHGAEERFAAASPVDYAYVVDDEDVSGTEVGADSPVAPSEPSPPLRKRLAPVVPSDVPEVVVRAVDAVIMGGGIEHLRAMVSEENGEVSHFIVDVLMVTMGGVDGLDEGAGDGTGAATRSLPSIMSSSRAAAIAADLLPYLPFGVEPSPRTRMSRGLLATLSACTRNRTMCSVSGLLAVLLNVAEKLFVGMCQSSKWDGTPLVQCIQVLGGHSVSVKDLHSWLLLIKQALGTRWATPLTLALEKAVGSNEAKGPAVTFEFDGESSGLLAPGDSRWPFSNGFGFATWIYVESFSGSLNTATTTAPVAASAASTSGKSSPLVAAAAACTLAGEGTKHMPRLFSFLTSDNHGIEAYFHGQFLVVESGAGKGKKASLHFTYEFKPQCWYFVGLEHTSKQGLLGKVNSELRLYVDGDLHESYPFELPCIAKPLNFCCIGTNPSPTIAGLQQCPLFAEMGPIYIFIEPIGPEKMSRLASRGGDAFPSFGNGAGLPWKATSDHIRKLAEDSYTLDIEIGGSLHLLYHPSLLNGRFCPDASPSGSTGMLCRPAEVLGMVHVSYRVRPAESLWALGYGGPMALLPLTVSNVEMDNLEPILGDLSLSLATASLSVSIFRIISLAIQHPGNKEEFCHTHGPELLSQVLHHLLETLSKLESGRKEILRDEELVTAIVSLCQSQRNDHGLKVQLFSTLLLDLKMWSSCNYVLQKKLLSSLADMVLAESTCMRDANALQMLLDGCRRCYWVIHEADSIDTFTLTGSERPLGNVNALVDELLVVIELLIGAASSTLASDDVHCLVGFVVDCPQPNQVARVLLLIYRLIVHPNISRAHMFAQSFISRGGVEALLVLLQREAKSDDNDIFCSCNVPRNAALWNRSSNSTNRDLDLKTSSSEANFKDHEIQSAEHQEPTSHEAGTQLESTSKWCLLKGQFLKNLGSIDVPDISDNVQNNIYNVDNADGVLVGIVHVLGALFASGHLTFASPTARPKLPSSFLTASNGEGNTMFEDRVSLLLFALQKAFQAAPRRLMTRNVYRALISSVIDASSSNDNLKNLYDSGCRFKHIPLLLVLLRSLPYASRAFQVRAIQDLLYLVCSHPKNRSMMASIGEWPEWILEVLISDHEMGDNKDSDGVSRYEVEDLIHNFVATVLEHSIRQKDGWKDVEATIHCAEWLSMVGGSSTGDQRIRREESLPIFKRRLLGTLLDFCTQELQVQQTEGIAAATAGVAEEGLMPKETKIQVEKPANLSVALAENAIVLLMFIEDHLRSRSQQFFMSCSVDSAVSPASIASSAASRSNSLSRTGSERLEAGSSRQSLSSDAGGLPVDVLASTADTNGQISAEVMELVTAAAAAEPYGSVRHAFISYGSCISDLSEGWKYRSQLWYGVCIPPKSNVFGGGGSGWVSWKSVLEKDPDGNWIELSLVKKSVAMQQALLLDSGFGGCLANGVGSGPGTDVMGALNLLLDSDQPFFCMLRLILVSMREDDSGEDDIFMRNISMKNVISEGLGCQSGSMMALDGNSSASIRKRSAALLWRVLGPILNMPVSESKRQRVLVASSILYSELWHAVSSDRKPLRKKYVGLIMPPFVAVLKRYRSVLAGIQELTSSDGQNPLLVDDWASAADALPVEAGVSMISPGWAAAFASPPVAMALAMIAAGASGTETIAPPTNKLRRRDTSLLERRSAKLHTFSSFQKPTATGTTPSLPTSASQDKAAAKAAALAAARDLERSAKIGSRRGLSAVAMATSGQRRAAGDIERAQRWNTSEAMGAAWMECLQSADSKSVSGRDFSALSYKYVALLVSSFALARNLQRVEMERRTHIEILNRRCMSIGVRAWRHLLHCLIETSRLYGPFGELLCTPDSILWKLDLTESSLRMRRFMKRSYNWLDHLGAAASHEEQKFFCDGAESNTCRTEDGDYSLTNVLSTSSLIAVAEAMSVDGGHGHTVQKETENICSSADDLLTNSLPPDPSFTGSVDSRSSDFSGVCNLVRSTVVAPGYKPSKDDERIIVELPSLMIRPLKVVRGTFQVTSKRINFIVDEHMSNNYMDDVASTSGQYDQQDKDRSWFISLLHKIYSRRYLLRQSALELFMVDRSNFLFDFEDIEARTHAYRAIVHTKPPYLNDIFLATQRPEQILKQTQLMERWAKWEISNFEYLMELNTLAGRSYNDITQYPVFPWVIADYQSKTLDLEGPLTYRDLSKPIGALNPARLKKFDEHYSSFEDPIIPKFHYSSHYSSPGTVLYYLARIEPFTTLSAQLQGAKFDHDDCMFSDVTRTWNSVLEGMKDVKELVPEMFYLPEVFTNVNSCGRLGSVVLPPWAQSPVDFIHKHRKALESDHVSAHLHEWIDLIFGYKQRGKEAEVANNVFPHFAYEGMVDIDKITDPVQRRATQNQISYFGQTPSQFLTVPHIRRRPLADILQLQTIFRNPSEVRSYALPSPAHCNIPASAMLVSNDCIVVIDANVPAVLVAMHHWQPNTPDGLGAPFLFHCGRNAINSSGGAIFRIFKGSTGSAEDNNFPRAIAFAASAIQNSSAVVVTCDKEVITGRHADNSVKLISPDGARTIETAYGHLAPVTCLGLSADSNYLVTGSRDTTAILWRIRQVCSSQQKNAPEPPPSTPTTPNSPLATGSSSCNSPSKILEPSRRRKIEGPMHVLRGHLGELTCCSVSSDLGLVASSSSMSGVLLHSLRTGRLIRKLDVQEAHSICLSAQGIVLIWNESEKRLSTFTVNGIPVATSVLSLLSGRVGCIEISTDGQFAVIGTCSSSNCNHDGCTSTDEDYELYKPDVDEDVQESNETRLSVHVPSICILDLYKLEVIHTLKLGEGQDVTALALNKENTSLLVSTADKQLIVFTNPAGSTPSVL